jgi:hypothetical protein
MFKHKPSKRNTQPKQNELKKQQERQEQNFFAKEKRSHKATSTLNPSLAESWQALSTKQKITLAIVFLLGSGLTITAIYYLAPQLVQLWDKRASLDKPNKPSARTPYITPHVGKRVSQPLATSNSNIIVRDYLPRTIRKQTTQELNMPFQEGALAIAKKLNIKTSSILEKIVIARDSGVDKPSIDTARIYMTCAILYAMDRSKFHEDYFRIALNSPQLKLVIKLGSSEVSYASQYLCNENTLIFINPLQHDQQHLINFLVPHELMHTLMAGASTGSPKLACAGNDPQLFQRAVAPFETEQEEKQLSLAIKKADNLILIQFADLHHKALAKKLTAEEKKSYQAALSALQNYQPLRYSWFETKTENLTTDKFIEKLAGGKEIIYLGKNMQILYPDSYTETSEGIQISGFLIPNPQQDKARALIEDTRYRYANLAEEYRLKGQALHNPQLTYFTEAHAYLMSQDPTFLEGFYSEVLAYTKQRIAEGLKKQTDFYQAELVRTPAYTS